MKHYNTRRRQNRLLRIQAGIILIVIGLFSSIIHLAAFDQPLSEWYLTPVHAQAPVSLKIDVREVLSVEDEIRYLADINNFPYPDYLVRLAKCESSLNPKAIGDSGKSRGLFQIHKGYHPEITDEQAFDIAFATEWTMQKIMAGQQHLWSCDKIIRNK